MEDMRENPQTGKIRQYIHPEEMALIQVGALFYNRETGDMYIGIKLGKYQGTTDFKSLYSNPQLINGGTDKPIGKQSTIDRLLAPLHSKYQAAGKGYSAMQDEDSLPEYDMTKRPKLGYQ